MQSYTKQVWFQVSFTREELLNTFIQHRHSNNMLYTVVSNEIIFQSHKNIEYVIRNCAWIPFYASLWSQFGVDDDDRPSDCRSKVRATPVNHFDDTTILTADQRHVCVMFFAESHCIKKRNDKLAQKMLSNLMEKSNYRFGEERRERKRPRQIHA